MRPAKLNARRLKPLLTIQPQTKQYLQHIDKSFAQAAPTFIMHAQSQTIRHLHTPIMHLIYPPKNLHNLCFSFLLGITAVPREIENNAYAKFLACENIRFSSLFAARAKRPQRRRARRYRCFRRLQNFGREIQK